MMSFAIYCILFGILVFCPETDGGNLTWNEPPPTQIVKAVRNPLKHFSSRQLFEGTINATLNWHFGLTELIFNSLIIDFEGNSVARVTSSLAAIRPPYVNQFGLDWIPNQNLVKLLIFNVTTDENGTFLCKVTADSLDGFDTFVFDSNVQVDVGVPPSNIIISSDLNVTAPAKLMLNCSADGKPEPTISWTFISDNTSVNMPLNITRREDTGSYRCTASNGFGKPLIKDVFVNVQVPPSNIIISSDLNVTAPAELTLNCSADGKPEPTISWRRVSDNTSVNIPLNISGEKDTGSYRCTASNGFGKPLIKDVFVNVHVPPSNIIISSDLNVTAPAELTLNCSADGKPEPTISWTRVSDSTFVNMPLNITGQKDTGSYRCTADNGVGKPLIKDVFVNVQGPPSNIIISSDLNVTAPAELTLNCSADGNPEPTISWRRVSDNTSVNMPLNITGEKGTGSYRCTASNGFGKPLIKDVFVNVHVPPSNIIISSDLNVTAPAELTLNCSADGKPEPTISWTRVSDSTFVNMPLNITGQKDTGSYRCTADNGVGKPLIKDVFVNVQGPPSNIIISSDLNVTAPAELTLNCSADGNPEPTISWRRVSDNTSVNMPLNITGEKGTGSYRCTASNGFGKPLIKDVFVNVHVPPSNIIISSDLNVTAPAELTLNCSADGKPEPTISWTRVSGNTSVNMPLNITGEKDTGSYRCTASNGFGKPLIKDVFVNVHVAPVVILPPEVFVDREKPASLICEVEGNPTPLISWSPCSGQSVCDKQRFNISELQTERANYTCTATNALGVDSATVLLIIGGKNVYLRLSVSGECDNKESVWEMLQKELRKVFANTQRYSGAELLNVRCGSLIFDVVLRFGIKVAEDDTISLFQSAIVDGKLGELSVNASSIIGIPPVKQSTPKSNDTARAPSTTEPTSTEPEGSADPQWAIIGGVAGGVVVLAMVVVVLTWWVHKQRKCRKDTKIHNSDPERHDHQGAYSQVQGAYAQSGPPAANGTDNAAEQPIEAEAAIPSYAVVDKSKKSKKQVDERPPEYAVVDKSKKKEKQEAAAIPTYAAVDKAKKKKKKPREEVPSVYAEVEKSKKKKKKIDDNNLYENLDEPKKEKKPGELLYADLGDFQNPSMPTVSISPQPLPAIKKTDPYESTEYADITQFLKGNATLPATDGNGDTEMKPKGPSKEKIQGNDKETPI